jgi:hypothetical protein
MKRHLRKFFPDWFIAVRSYYNTHGYLPNFFRPLTFNEKVLHRMLFDRRPIWGQMADKFAVRSYVESRLGPSVLPELYCVTTQPETMLFDALPDAFVVKPTHGSGWVEIVTDKSQCDRDVLIETCYDWLGRSFYDMTREWPYKYIEPRIIIEQFIDDGSGEAPRDYKLFVFGGKAVMIQVDSGRFNIHKRRLYSPEWQKLPALLEKDDLGEDVPKPPHLSDMIAAAEILGKDIDFVRVDFYDTAGGLYFGELTTTPGRALDRFRPKEFDQYLGGFWKLS